MSISKNAQELQRNLWGGADTKGSLVKLVFIGNLLLNNFFAKDVVLLFNSKVNGNAIVVVDGALKREGDVDEESCGSSSRSS